jgi:hypothetical protein
MHRKPGDFIDLKWLWSQMATGFREEKVVDRLMNPLSVGHKPEVDYA